MSVSRHAGQGDPRAGRQQRVSVEALLLVNEAAILAMPALWPLIWHMTCLAPCQTGCKYCALPEVVWGVILLISPSKIPVLADKPLKSRLPSTGWNRSAVGIRVSTSSPQSSLHVSLPQ